MRQDSLDSSFDSCLVEVRSLASPRIREENERDESETGECGDEVECRSPVKILTE